MSIWRSIQFVSFRFDLFRFVLLRFVSICFVSFRSVSFRFDLFRFVSICFVSFRFVSFRFDLFRFVPFRFCFVSHFTGTQFIDSQNFYIHFPYKLLCTCMKAVHWSDKLSLMCPRLWSLEDICIGRYVLKRLMNVRHIMEKVMSMQRSFEEFSEHERRVGLKSVGNYEAKTVLVESANQFSLEKLSIGHGTPWNICQVVSSIWPSGKKINHDERTIHYDFGSGRSGSQWTYIVYI